MSLRALPVPPMKLVFLLSGFLMLFALIIGVAWQLHRKLHEETIEAAPSDSQSTPVPFSALQEMVLRIRSQEKELESLRREARTRTHDSLRLTQELLSTLPSGVIFFDRGAVVQQANPAARVALGFGSPLGLRAAELFRDAEVREDDGTRLGLARELIEEALVSGSTLQRKNLDYVTPSGQQRPLGLTFSPIRRNEQTTGLICLLSDLTTIRALEEELVRKKNLASLGEMAAGIAHEFKNALATVSGYAQMIDAAAVDNEVRGHSRKILDQVQLLSAVATEFLIFARPMTVAPEPVDLNRLLSDCVENLRVQDFRRVDIRLNGDFPSVLGDQVLLDRACINVIRNACEAIAQSGREGRVEIRLGTVDKGMAQILVCDDGPGLTPDVSEKIFIPFFTTKASGTGLGLAMAHKIVTAHNGTIVLLDSSPGHTVFALNLPLAPGSHPAAPSETGSEAESEHPSASASVVSK
jgi:signal transduction histidine kinase